MRMQAYSMLPCRTIFKAYENNKFKHVLGAFQQQCQKEMQGVEEISSKLHAYVSCFKVLSAAWSQKNLAAFMLKARNGL